ncbi:MAG: hypothetical protein ACOVQG_10580 [Crocinitomicaceae bacterium]|jgi:hypothetical protein
MKLVVFLGILVVTSAALVYVVYLFLKKQGEKELIYLQGELKKQRQEYFLPTRLEAYQRAILLMERIHPNSLVMRLHNPGLPARALQMEFIKSIREEYDHNVAQQLFISPEGWQMIKNSKEDIIKLINAAGEQMSPTSNGLDLSSKIFEMLAQLKQLPSEVTVEFLKKEFQQLF